MGDLGDIDLEHDEELDRLLERKPKMSKTTSQQVDFRIAGVTFEGRQAHLADIMSSATFTMVGAVEVKLEREPTNKFDKNAIKVVYKDLHLGYVPAPKAEELAPLLDKGWKATDAFITSIGNANGNGPLGAKVEAVLEKK